MREKLLAYLLNDLGAEERKRIEDRLEHDPIWQRELERLESCIKAFEVDLETADPPADLVHRTCSYVQHAVEARVPRSTQISVDAASSVGSCDCQVGTSRWSFADLVVGTAVLLAIAMLLLPALRESRDTARRLKCQDNLRQLGTALVEYAEQQRHGLPHIGLHENAGTFVIDLAESGILSREQLAELLVCPSSKLADDVFDRRVVMRVPTRQELRNASKDSFARMLRLMSGSYAYQLGYRDANGRYRQIQFVGRSDAPMLADAPSFSVAGFQSANHGGCGQYVVFQDLSSRYVKQCVSVNNSDHLFLNADRQQAAGRHVFDVVLGRSEVGPSGPLVPAR